MSWPRIQEQGLLSMASQRASDANLTQFCRECCVPKGHGHNYILEKASPGQHGSWVGGLGWLKMSPS